MHSSVPPTWSHFFQRTREHAPSTLVLLKYEACVILFVHILKVTIEGLEGIKIDPIITLTTLMATIRAHQANSYHRKCLQPSNLA